MKFSDLGICDPILRALLSEGYLTATPIQARAIPEGIAGKDILGSAQTGTGKTAAFAVPVLQRLANNHTPGKAARSLILCPTRELATQIADGFRAYGKHLKLRYTTIFGGVSEFRQIQALRNGLDIIVATPGRLLDLMNQGHVDLRSIETLVLDEADRMLDMGFINDIRKIVAKVPAHRQTMMFSATMPNEIRQLANSLLKHPVAVQIEAKSLTVDKIDQSVYFVEKQNKGQLLAHLYHELPMARAIVFTRTKHGADRVVRHLHTRGIRAEAIHGNKSQNARQRALENFRASRTPILVATDIASRGIDIDDVSHVVNYDLTHEPETYVHRIGRTARAGAGGVAVSFCDREERSNLKAIERLIRRTIPVKTDQPAYVAQPAYEPRESQHQHQERQERQPAHRQDRHPSPRHERQAAPAQRSRPAHAARRPEAAASHGARPTHPMHQKRAARRGGAGVRRAVHR